MLASPLSRLLRKWSNLPPTCNIRWRPLATTPSKPAQLDILCGLPSMCMTAARPEPTMSTTSCGPWCHGQEYARQSPTECGQSSSNTSHHQVEEHTPNRKATRRHTGSSTPANPASSPTTTRCGRGGWRARRARKFVDTRPRANRSKARTKRGVKSLLARQQARAAAFLGASADLRHRRSLRHGKQSRNRHSEGPRPRRLGGGRRDNRDAALRLWTAFCEAPGPPDSVPQASQHLSGGGRAEPAAVDPPLDAPSRKRRLPFQ